MTTKKPAKKTAPKKAAKPSASKPAASATNPQKPVNITLNLTMPKAPQAPQKKEAPMPRGKRGTRKPRAPRPGYGLTAGATGSQGGRAYWAGGGMPKPRTDPAKYTVINVQAPGGAQRKVSIGKKGGVYAQGKWDSVKKITAALPMAAAGVVAAGYIGAELKNNATIKSWSTRFPGGYTGMGLAAAAVGGYVAYKNRHVLGLLVGLGIAAWALIKLAANKFKSTDMEEEALTPETMSAEPLSLPAGGGSDKDLIQEATGGLGVEGKKYFQLGSQALDNGNFDNAIVYFNNAWRASGDYTMSLYAANAYFDKAMKQGAFLKQADGSLKLNSDLKTAKALYEQYIEKGGVTAEVNQEARDGAVEFAQGRITHINSMAQTGKTSNANPLEVSGNAPVYMAGNDDEEVIEEIYTEGDGDDEEIIEEEIEGDDDEEVIEEYTEGEEGDEEVIEEEVTEGSYVYSD